MKGSINLWKSCDIITDNESKYYVTSCDITCNESGYAITLCDIVTDNESSYSITSCDIKTHNERDYSITVVPATKDPLLWDQLVLCDRLLSAPNSIFCKFCTLILDRTPTRDHPLTAEGAVFRCRDHCTPAGVPSRFTNISNALYENWTCCI